MHKSIHILILEDVASDADLIEFELMEAGFDFILKRARDEKEFLRALDEFSPDLILSDYDLPQYTGALALIAAKARFPDVPFILITGELDKDAHMIGEILAKGASSFILKAHLDQLSTAVHTALGFSGRL